VITFLESVSLSHHTWPEMEAMGTVACFTQLAGQLIICAQTINSFIQQVKNAPKYVAALVADIESTSILLQQLAENDDGDEVTLQSLKLATEILKDLQDLLKELEIGMRRNGWKGKVKWASIMALGKDQLVTEMVQRLERAKSSLNGALLHQLL
jgi:hypothetical protein